MFAASILPSVTKPSPVCSTSNLTLSDMVEMKSGWSSWWLSARISTSPTAVLYLRPSSALATLTGSLDLAFFMATTSISNMVLIRQKEKSSSLPVKRFS